MAEFIYWNLAPNEALLAIATRYVGIVRNMYNVVRTRFDDGYVAKNDLLMIETRLREAEYSRVNADNLYRVSLQNFNILMGAVPLTQHTVADSVTMPVQLPMYAGVQEALSRRPDSEVQPAALGGCAGVLAQQHSQPRRNRSRRTGFPAVERAHLPLGRTAACRDGFAGGGAVFGVRKIAADRQHHPGDYDRLDEYRGIGLADRHRSGEPRSGPGKSQPQYVQI